MATQVILKPGKDEALRRFHPWVFSGAIQKISGQVNDGDLVEVCTHRGEVLAAGHYQKGSITVRIISFDETTEAGPDFWEKKLENACRYRRSLGLIDNPATDCYRLVHAEGDDLPGLMIDLYGKTAVLQCHSIGMHRARHLVAGALQEVLGNKLEAIFDKSKETLPANYASTVNNGYLLGKATSQTIVENGHNFIVNWESGQKTGFFLDQRDNRQLLSRYVSGKKVLNAFSYSGGFSVYALKAGASLVHSVDASRTAIEWAEKNVSINFVEGVNHQAYCEDVMKYLKTCPNYDVMVVDPPAFAKNIGKRHNAVIGYKRLNAAALQKVEKGGMMLTFSCSQVVDRELFYNTIVAAAIEANRQVRVMQHLSQPADHPVKLFHPEGAYLKGLALWVD
jgi:23S rRNA (cytosine1962-C5)-methyltransferase